MHEPMQLMSVGDLDSELGFEISNEVECKERGIEIKHRGEN